MYTNIDHHGQTHPWQASSAFSHLQTIELPAALFIVLEPKETKCNYSKVFFSQATATPHRYLTTASIRPDTIDVVNRENPRVYHWLGSRDFSENKRKPRFAF